MKNHVVTMALSLVALTASASPAAAYPQDTYPGTMCNSYLGNVGVNAGVEIVNGTAGDILVDCPFRKNSQGQYGPTCANDHQFLDFRGNIDCTLRAMMPNGAGWAWSPDAKTASGTGYYAYRWNYSHSTYPNSTYGAGFECIMHANSAINNYRVWQCA